MTLPTPVPGLVIRYAYLWHAEHSKGREEGVKDRPCAIVLAVRDDDDRQRVIVVPITHSEPADDAVALELPAAVKRRLGLDAERSWAILNEANRFVWPGPDLRTQPGGDVSTVAYGVRPPKVLNALRERFLAALRARLLHIVPRTD